MPTATTTKKKTTTKRARARKNGTSAGQLPEEELKALLKESGKKGGGRKTKKSEKIEVPAPEFQTIELVVYGIMDSSLISHAWAKKSTMEMLAKQMKKAMPAKEAKDPVQDYMDSLYLHPAGGYGIPSIAFKKAAVGACRFLDMAMTLARGALHVPGELIQILGEPNPRLDHVRVGMGTADLRFRGEFQEWAAIVPVRFNKGVISAAQVANLFRNAGTHQGIGDWRPEKEGNHGMFDIASEAQAKKLLKQFGPAAPLTKDEAKEQVEDMLGFSLDESFVEPEKKTASKKTTSKKKATKKKTTKRKSTKKKASRRK